MFSVSTGSPDSKETELGSSDLEAFPSAGKNAAVVLVPCRAWKSLPTATSGDAYITNIPAMDGLSVRDPKLLQELVSHGLTSLPFCF